MAKSEVNANPKDTKDYEQGYGPCPRPTGSGDQDREKYAGDRRERPLHAEVREARQVEAAARRATTSLSAVR